MPENQKAGTEGEEEVITHAPCPNCRKSLMLLTKNYPIYDLRYTGCSFWAQVKSNESGPKDEIFGAGWEIMNKVLKSEFMVLPWLQIINGQRRAY